MRNLQIEMEINGKAVYVGNILGNDYQDAKFSYNSTLPHLQLPLNVV